MSLGIEDDLKKKFRRLQKVVHRLLIEKELIKKKQQVIDILQNISDTISQYDKSQLFAKCSNCKVISDESHTFRSPFFGNDHFIMPIHSSELTEFGIFKYEYPPNNNSNDKPSILYYFEKVLLLPFLDNIKTQLDENNSDTLSSNLVLSLSILSVLLPSSFLATNNIEEFYQKQQGFFSETAKPTSCDQ